MAAPAEIGRSRASEQAGSSAPKVGGSVLSVYPESRHSFIVPPVLAEGVNSGHSHCRDYQTGIGSLTRRLVSTQPNFDSV